MAGSTISHSRQRGSSLSGGHGDGGLTLEPQRSTGPRGDMVEAASVADSDARNSFEMAGHALSLLGAYGGYPAFKPGGRIPHPGPKALATMYSANLGHCPGRSQQNLLNAQLRLKLIRPSTVPLGLQLAIDTCSAPRLTPGQRRDVVDGCVTDSYDGGQGRSVYKLAFSVGPRLWFRSNMYGRHESYAKLRPEGVDQHRYKKQLPEQEKNAPFVLFGASKRMLQQAEHFVVGYSWHAPAADAPLLQALDARALKPGEVIIDTSWCMQRRSAEVYPPGPIAFSCVSMRDKETSVKLKRLRSMQFECDIGMKTKQTHEYALEYGSLLDLLHLGLGRRVLPANFDTDAVLRTQLPRLFGQERAEQSARVVFEGVNGLEEIEVDAVQDALLPAAAALTQPERAPRGHWLSELFATVWGSARHDLLPRAQRGFATLLGELHHRNSKGRPIIQVSWQKSLRMQMLPFSLQRLLRRCGLSLQEEKDTVTIEKGKPRGGLVEVERMHQRGTDGAVISTLRSHLKNPSGFERATETTVEVATSFSSGDDVSSGPSDGRAALALSCSVVLPAIDNTRVAEANANWLATHRLLALLEAAPSEKSPSDDAFAACGRRIESTYRCDTGALLNALAAVGTNEAWRAEQHRAFGVSAAAFSTLHDALALAGDVEARHQAIGRFVRDGVEPGALDHVEWARSLYGGGGQGAEPFADATLCHLLAVACLAQLALANGQGVVRRDHDISGDHLEALRIEISRRAGQLYAGRGQLLASERGARSAALHASWQRLTELERAPSRSLRTAEIAATGRQILAAMCALQAAAPASNAADATPATAGPNDANALLLAKLSRTALWKEKLPAGGRPVTTATRALYPYRAPAAPTTGADFRPGDDLLAELLARLDLVTPESPDPRFERDLRAALDLALRFGLQGDGWPIDVVSALAALADAYAAARSSKDRPIGLRDFLPAPLLAQLPKGHTRASADKKQIRVERARCSQAHFDALWGGDAYRLEPEEALRSRQPESRQVA